MAEKLEYYNFGVSKTYYPVNDWLNGEIWRLKEGEDYKSYNSVIAQLRKGAIKIGKKVRTKYERNNCIVIQAFDPSERKKYECKSNKRRQK